VETINKKEFKLNKVTNILNTVILTSILVFQVMTWNNNVSVRPDVVTGYEDNVIKTTHEFIKKNCKELVGWASRHEFKYYQGSNMKGNWGDSTCPALFKSLPHLFIDPEIVSITDEDMAEGIRLQKLEDEAEEVKKRDEAREARKKRASRRASRKRSSVKKKESPKKSKGSLSSVF
jgi:hypothetical protein